MWMPPIPNEQIHHSTLEARDSYLRLKISAIGASSSHSGEGWHASSKTREINFNKTITTT